MNIKNLLMIQPPSMERVEPFIKESELRILTWFIYLETFLKSKFQNLNFDLLYLPIEQKIGNITPDPLDDITQFNSQLDKLIESSLNFEFGSEDSSMVLISVSTSYHYLISKTIANYFREKYPSSIIIFGGAHASACPDDFNNVGDYVVKGEGEISMFQILQNNPKKQDSLKILENNIFPNLNELPPISLSLYDKYIKNISNLLISLSRGCPFACVYCQEETLFKACLNKVNRWRPYSPKRALIEFGRIVKYGLENGIEHYGITDQSFGLSRDWISSFLENYNFEGVKSLWAESRIDILNENLVRTFQQKKIFFWYGVESLSPRLLSLMNKASNPKIYLKKFFELFQTNMKLENYFAMNFIINFPESTIEDEIETYNQLENMIRDFNVAQNVGLFLIPFHLYPGNPLYKRAISKKHLKNGFTAYFPYWWTDKNLLEFGPTSIKPSNGFNLRDAIEIYISRYKQILELLFENTSIKSLPEVMLKHRIKAGISRLDHKKEEFLDFLDRYNIEIDKNKN